LFTTCWKKSKVSHRKQDKIWFWKLQNDVKLWSIQMLNLYNWIFWFHFVVHLWLDIDLSVDYEISWHFMKKGRICSHERKFIKLSICTKTEQNFHHWMSTGTTKCANVTAQFSYVYILEYFITFMSSYKWELFHKIEANIYSSSRCALDIIIFCMQIFICSINAFKKFQLKWFTLFKNKFSFWMNWKFVHKFWEYFIFMQMRIS